MKNIHTTILCPVTLGALLSTMMLACDDSSSASAAQEDPVSSASQDEVLSSSSQEVLPLSSEAAIDDALSSEALPESSATPESSAEEECYDGSASIDLYSVERINFSCPNSMTMYNHDTWTYYKCDGSTVVEIDMPPCSL